MGWKLFIGLAFLLAFSAAHTLNDSNASDAPGNLTNASKLVCIPQEPVVQYEADKEFAMEKYLAATVMTVLAGAGMYTTLMALVFLGAALLDACRCWKEGTHGSRR